MSGNARPVTAEAVRAAYRDAKPTWATPDAGDCGAIADILERYRLAHKNRATRLAAKPSPSGRRLIAQSNAVRGAIGTLLRDLPSIAAWATANVAPGTAHAESLRALLDTARHVAELWPCFDGSLKRFDPRSAWARGLDCWAGCVLTSWHRANPGRRIGKPLSPDQPATRLLLNLLALVENDPPTAEQVSQHFTRDASAFVLMEMAEKSRQTIVA